MNRKQVLLWGAAAGITVGGAVLVLAYLELPVGEIVDLAAQGGDRVLREPMRPASGGANVLIFALDGVGDDEFREAVRSGGAPNIAALLGAPNGPDGYEHGYAKRQTLSILPSTTMAAWSSIYTGQPAGHTGVPGNEWFIREHRRFVAPAPVSVDGIEHTLEMLTDGLVGNAIHVPTLFELADVRSFVSLAPVYRGADLFTTPETSAVADLFLEVAKGVVGNQSVEREAYSEIDLQSAEHVVEAIAKYGVPDLQVAYFPGIDLFAHVASHPLAQEKLYLRTVIDSAVGRILSAYDSLDALEDTYVLFIADHGHTPVMSDDRHSLGTAGEDEPPALIARQGFRIRSFVLEPDEGHQDYQATVAYQGAIAYIYLADRSTCPRAGDRCDWNRPPRLQEDVLPVARAFHRVNTTGNPIHQLAHTLDLILTREPRPVTEPALPFQIFDGERLVPIAAYLAAHPRPDLLDFANRMDGLSSGPYGHRAGDILLLALSGLQRPIEERFYFSGPYQSWHGSAETQDSEVPLVVGRKGASGTELRRLVDRALGAEPSQLDLVRLVRTLLAQPQR